MEKFLYNLLNIRTAFAQPFATTSTNAPSSVASETGNQVTNLVETIFRSIPYWITGFLVIVLSLILARVVKSMVENKMTEAGVEEEHREIQIVAGRAASATVLLIGITAGLKIAGLDLTSIIAAAAFGVGFAMKDIIMNFISGIIVLLQKQFTIGDWIKVKGTTGVIQEIQSRYTVIKKFDGTKVIVPNSELFKNQVTSLTSNPYRRFQLDLGVDLYMDLKEVIDEIYKSIDKCNRILKHPKPNIIVRQPGAFYNSLRIRCWVESKKGVLKPISELTRQIHKDFYRRGWAWPYPTQTLIMDKDVPPDVNQRTKEYIEKHKKALKKETGLIQQQQQILVEQEKKTETPAQSLPQAQQIGVGGPAMETPVWLQQAAQENQPVAPQAQEQPVNQQPALEPQQPVQGQQPQVVIQNIEIGPEMKTVPQAESQYQPVPQTQAAMPIVTATDVVHAQPDVPTVAMPLPDVQAPIATPPNPQN